VRPTLAALACATLVAADGRAARPVREHAARPVSEDARAAQGVERGKTVTVPFDASNNLVVVNVLLEGKGPFRLVLDTGATADAVTPEVAKELGLKVEGGALIDTGLKTKATGGVTRVGRVEIGGCALADQVFIVAPLPASFPFQGFIGAEFFRRFAVGINFRTHQLTLTPSDTFNYRGGGAIIPLKFYKRDTPQVRAAVDGASGWFKIDTGYNDALALFPKFLAEHGLLKKYAPQRSEAGGATLAGEVGDVAIARVGVLKLGAVELRGLDAALYREEGTSNDAFAGALGTKAFERFNAVFDYRGGRLILETPTRD
jgi:predicted aspartyl protease